jgi:hypothetical protein
VGLELVVCAFYGHCFGNKCKVTITIVVLPFRGCVGSVGWIELALNYRCWVLHPFRLGLLQIVLVYIHLSGILIVQKEMDQVEGRTFTGVIATCEDRDKGINLDFMFEIEWSKSTDSDVREFHLVTSAGQFFALKGANGLHFAQCNGVLSIGFRALSSFGVRDGSQAHSEALAFWRGFGLV